MRSGARTTRGIHVPIYGVPRRTSCGYNRPPPFSRPLCLSHCVVSASTTRTASNHSAAPQSQPITAAPRSRSSGHAIAPNRSAMTSRSRRPWISTSFCREGSGQSRLSSSSHKRWRSASSSQAARSWCNRPRAALNATVGVSLCTRVLMSHGMPAVAPLF